MRFLVCVKQVPDTTLIDVDEDGNLLRAGVPSILDPYSEHALETAMNLRQDGDRVIVVTMGPPQAVSALRRCLEIGADEAFLLTDRAFAGADVHATSRTLTAFIERFGDCPDLILMGKQAADGDTAQVPSEVAEMLGRDQFCYAVSVSREDDGFKVTQDYGDELRTCRAKVGSVISVSEGDLNRRLPSIRRFLEASDIPITELDRVGLGLGAFSVGMKGSRTRIVHSENVRRERRCEVFDGSDPSVAASRIKEVL